MPVKAKKNKPKPAPKAVRFNPCRDQGDCLGRPMAIPGKLKGLSLRRCPFCEKVHVFRPEKRGVPSRPVYVGRYPTQSEAINAGLASVG